MKTTGYNKARATALQMGREAFARGDKRSALLDPKLEALYEEWKPVSLRKANTIALQWYTGWDLANVAAPVKEIDAE